MTNFIRTFRVPLALLLAAALLCSLCGCNFFYDPEDISEILGATDPEDPPSDVTESESVFSLSYYTEEPLNPYTAASRTNSELLRLCYSGLFSVDETYTAVPVLAESYEVNGNTVSIRLRSDIRFSDGSAVTAADCEQSYARAAKKDSIWASSFSYIRSYDAVDERTFQVVFYSYSPSQLNLLNVPVVKSGTEPGEGYPIGCGRYLLTSDDGLALVKSSCNCIAGSYAIDRIELLAISDREALIYNFNYGKLHAVCADLSLGAKEYRSDSEMVTLSTNRFTFLVVNRSRKELADVNFSVGLSYLLDRNALVASALNSFADPVWYPLNPSWAATRQANLNPDIFSPPAAGDAFVQAGLVLKDTQRVYGGKPVTLRILVNRENASRVKAAEFVAESLRMAGFGAEVVQATWDEYQVALETLDYDLYLGEVNLPANLDLSVLFTPEVCNTGELPGTYDLLRAEAKAVLNGETEVRTFVSNFQNSLPFIPLYYAQDALAVSMEVSGQFGSSPVEYYAGIEDWILIEQE